MDEHKITQLFRLLSGEVQERTRFCPDDEYIVEFFEGTLDGQRRTNLKRHIIDCRFCMARIGNLERLVNEDCTNGVSGNVLAEAKSLGKQSLTARILRYSPAWTTAAV